MCSINKTLISMRKTQQIRIQKQKAGERVNPRRKAARPYKGLYAIRKKGEAGAIWQASAKGRLIPHTYAAVCAAKLRIGT